MGLFSFLSGKNITKESTISLLVAFNWQKSVAHRLLLTKFITPSSTLSFVDQDYWRIALGENPLSAITRFQDEGLLVEPALDVKVASGFGLTNLKAQLRKRGLKVSGTKLELAARLVQFDPDGMQNAFVEQTFLVCSDLGTKIASQIKSSNDAEKEQSEQESFALLGKLSFIDACRRVAQYEAMQAIPRGVNMDWKNYDPARDIAILKEIFSGNPKILTRFNCRFTECQTDKLRIPAGMQLLWGELKLGWLPIELLDVNHELKPDNDLEMDVETSVRMLLFYAKHRVDLDRYRKLNFVKHIEILATNDSCEACKKLSTKRYNLDDVPELPHVHCTNGAGCRCQCLPVTN